MGFKELLAGCRNRKLPAKAQRRKEHYQVGNGTSVTLLGSQEASSGTNGPSRNCSKPAFATLRLCVKLLLVLSIAFTAAAQQRRPMAPADILRVANVGDAQISPGGEWVVYTVSTVEGDATRSTLWLANAAFEGRPGMRAPATETRTDFDQVRQPPTPLLPAGWYAANPRWSPDGKSVAFLGDHESLKGIWIVTLERRQPRFIVPVQDTNFFITYAGESLAWSPDSRIIAYISAGDDNEAVDVERKSDPRVIDRIQYKSRTSLSDRLRTHVYFTYVDNPEPRQLTTGQYYDHALTFSPRGDEVAFVSNHEPDPDANNNSDIFAVDLHAQVRQITNTKGCEYEPAWSPDGKWITYTATRRDVTTIDSVAEDTHVWLIDAAGNGARELAVEQDLRARSPRWSADGKWVYYLANDHGCTTIFRIGTEARQPERFSVLALDGRLTASFDSPGALLPARRDQTFQLTGFSLPTQSMTIQISRRTALTLNIFLAFTLADPTHPADVWLGFGNLPLRRLSAPNEGLLRSMSVMPPEEINLRSFDGARIQGWLIKPIEWRADRKYPLILSIHGGPHGMYGWAFNPAFQVYAAHGYAVLYLNPRGSSGYGQKFSDGTLNEWGGGDYKDLMAGVDEALRRYSWIDQDRMGVTGGSYGGFMTNWIITQTPRFKAAVSAASVSNLISFYSTSLYQDLVHAEFGGFPWDNYDLLWQWSPLRYAKQAQTPTLFIHGEQDNDVHITQAEEMYMALKRRGVDTVLVRYPREGHGLREPQHRVDALERTLAWFDRYLK